MNDNGSRRHPQTGAAFAVLFSCVLGAHVGAQPAAAQPASVSVRTALGGFILGYAVDRNGNEGLMCEARTLPNGTHDVAIETFDQSTGGIVRVVRMLRESNDDFVAWGIGGESAGLVEFEHAGAIGEGPRFLTLKPLSANAVTGRWTPPMAPTDKLISMTDNQEVPYAAFLGFELGVSGRTFVFESSVTANRSGPRIILDNPVFSLSNSPVIAFDWAANHAVVAASNGCPVCRPTIGIIDLMTGSQSTFSGLGLGYVNGIAVDSATAIACTSTEIDFSLQFYDLRTRSGFSVRLPGAVSQAQSGKAVAVDPVHRLFLVGQVFSSTAPSGSSVLVFDEQGKFIKAINGLSLPSSSVPIALNPVTRTGYVAVASSSGMLQSFGY